MPPLSKKIKEPLADFCGIHVHYIELIVYRETFVFPLRRILLFCFPVLLTFPAAAGNVKRYLSCARSHTPHSSISAQSTSNSQTPQTLFLSGARGSFQALLLLSGGCARA